MAAAPDRTLETVYDPPLEAVVERPLARFGAWYEFFPRSSAEAPDAPRDARDGGSAASRYVAQLGFDVVYLPPIHPIGTDHRKGRNNALQAAACRSRLAVGDRRRPRAGTRASTRSSARSRTSRAFAATPSASASRSRSTSRSSARRITHTCASIRRGSRAGRTAACNTRRIRRRSTRTSCRSISARAEWRALWQELRDVVAVLGRPRQSRCFASTTRTRSRSSSGAG